jgi:hypothetical protein
LTVDNCIIRRVHTAGLFAAEVDASNVTRTRISDVSRAPGNDQYGDGFVAFGFGVASVVVDDLDVEGADRVGIAAFEATVQLSNSTLECNSIDLNADGGATITDLGGNRCGCGAEENDCKVLSSSVEPPEAPTLLD